MNKRQGPGPQKRPNRRSAALKRRRRRRGPWKRLKYFVRRYALPLVIGAGVAVAGIVALIIVLSSPGPSVPASEPVQDVVDELPEGYIMEEDEYDYSQVDEETLAGLAGDPSAFEDSDVQSGDVLIQHVIGVITDNVTTAADALIMRKVEEAALAAIDGGRIDALRFYDSDGDSNQQVQDIRNLINVGARAVILDIEDKAIFDVMAGMAKQEGIPVVAINAPSDEGYDINIKVDAGAYGAASAAQIAGALPGGGYLQVAFEPDEESAARLEMVGSALASYPALTSLGQLSTTADEFYPKLTELKEEGTVPDALVTADGAAALALMELINRQDFPRVFAGDTSAAFIRLAYELKNGGVAVEPEPTPEPSATPSPTPEPTPTGSPGTSPSPSPTASPTPAPIMVRQPQLKIVAEGGPEGAGGFAFECALRLSEGMTPRADVFVNGNYSYTQGVVVTDDNLAGYYELIKDKEEDYRLCLWPTGAEADAMFEG